MSRSKTPLKDVITRDVVYVNPQDTVREALEVMVENRVSAMPVLDARNHCVGVISVTDIIGMTKELSDELDALSDAGRLDHDALVDDLEHADMLTELVKERMSAEVISVHVECTIQDAAQQMLRNHVHRLVVLDKNEYVVGVVSTMDLLAAFAGVEHAVART
jgi:CBS domain-containing protein